MGLNRGLASRSFSSTRAGGAGADPRSGGQSPNRQSVSAGIAGPPALGRDLGLAFDDQGETVLDDPLDRLALFEFHGFGQRRWADQVELPSLVGAFNELNFGKVAHKAMITLALSLVNRFDSIFSHDRGDAEIKRVVLC